MATKFEPKELAIAYVTSQKSGLTTSEFVEEVINAEREISEVLKQKDRQNRPHAKDVL